MTRTLQVAAALVLGVLMFAGTGVQDACAQSGAQGSGNRGSATRQDQQAQQPFEVRFWNYLTSAQYRNWAPIPGNDGSAYEGQRPHGAQLKVYMNRTAVGNPETLPHGSIIIKENYGPNAESLKAITVMYRAKGFDSENNDWYWIKYNPDGTVARTPADQGNQPILGKVSSCIDCHSGAGGGDYSFFND